MKKFRILRNVFVIIMLILSHLMCTQIAFNYATMLCGIEHKGFSAPANISFIIAVPYGIAIIICLVFVFVFNNKLCSKEE